jgi:hypothetical protein
VLLMKPISVIKENTGVLSREKLEQTGYGMLCQAFALQILNGMSVTDGLYQQLALEFPEEQEPAAPAENVYRISLDLVLETLRKLEPSGEAERVRKERLLKRLETRLEKKAELEPVIAAKEQPAMRSVAITQNNFLVKTLLQLSKTGRNGGNQPTLAGVLLRAEAAARAAAEGSTAGRTGGSTVGRGGVLPGRAAGTGFQGEIFVASLSTGRSAQALFPADAETALLVEGMEPASGKSKRSSAQIAADAERPLERHLLTRLQKQQTSLETEKALYQSKMQPAGDWTAHGERLGEELTLAEVSPGSTEDRTARETAAESGARERSAERIEKAAERPLEPARLGEELTLAEVSPGSTEDGTARETAAKSGVRERSAERTEKAAERPAGRAAVGKNAERAASSAATAGARIRKPTEKAEEPVVKTSLHVPAKSAASEPSAAKEQSRGQVDTGAMKTGVYGSRAAGSAQAQQEARTAAPQPYGILPVSRDIRTAAVPAAERPMEPARIGEELTLAEVSPGSAEDRTAREAAAETGARERSAKRTEKAAERPAGRAAVGKNAERAASSAATAGAKIGKPTAKSEAPIGKTSLHVPAKSAASEPSAAKEQSRGQTGAGAADTGAMKAGVYGSRAAGSAQAQQEARTAAPQPYGILPVSRDIRTAAVPAAERPMEPARIGEELTLAEVSPGSAEDRTAREAAAESGVRERSAERTEKAALEDRALPGRASPGRARQPDASKLNRRTESRSAQTITQVGRDIRAARYYTGENLFRASGSAGPSYADTDAPELEYAAGVGQSRQELKKTAPQMDSEYVRSLPDWAQNFLKNSRASMPGTAPADSGANPDGMICGTARNLSVLPVPDAGAEQVQWTAPQRRPAELSLRQKEEKQAERRPEKPSDTEIRHVADKVYKLIEERIRRERRMLDF